MKIETNSDYQVFIKNLIANAPKISEQDYQKQKAICCSEYKLLGYYIPELRKMAKEIFKEGYTGYFKFCKNEYYEEVMIKGFILAMIKDKKIVLEHLYDYVELIDSWSICDSFITSFYCYKKETTPDDYKMFCEYALSEKEFHARFGIMMIFRYCLKEENLSDIFKLMLSINNHTYYVDMALSWLLCESMVKFPDETYPLIKQQVFTKFIQNKAISKCHDSYRIDSKLKEEMKQYRIK